MGKSAIMSVRITGNSDDAVKAFEKATAKASAFGSFMGNIAAKGVSMLWDKLKGFTGAVMEMSDSTDKFKNTMSFAGIDTAAVDKATAAARKYADETVYDLSTIQNTTAQLAANGIGDYTGLTEAAGNLNAVAGGNAETFKSVAMVMTQTAGAGKLTTENWNQLTDAIPGAAGRLQEAMLKAGAYTGNFRDAMEEGEITADEFNAAIMELGMTDVAKQAATSTQTMEGALGNLEAAVTGGLTDAFNLVKPMVTSAIGGAAEKITAFSSKATSALKGIISLVKDGTFTSEFAQAFNVSEDSGLVSAILTIRDTAIGVFDAVKSRADSVKAGFDSLTQGVGAVLGPIVQFAADTFGLTGNLDAGADASRTFGDILDAIADTLDAAGTWMQENAQWLGSLVVGIGGAVAAYQAWQTAIGVWQAATKLATGVQAAFNLVMNANPIMLVITAIAALVAALVWFFTQTETGRQIWSNFTNWLGTCVNNIIGFFQALPGRIGAFFSNAAQSVTNTWNNVVDWFRGLPGRILNAIGNVGNTLYNAGKSIIDGFLNGLKAAWDNVTGFVGGIADWIKEHKGPPSYDKILLTNNGRLIMQGFAKGLTTGFDRDVRRSIARINGGLAGMSFGVQAGFDGTPSIQPMTVNITVNGVLDGEDAAKRIRQVLRDWDRKRS
ncbi:tape measure protein [Bifidobacterium imperatoris]|uniref:Tail protein n=1 Tax=Bifidobacterium imperatoris TaxID=2020965 RepID=A0A2N5IQW1_9BIFI|nr:tape measure protein [Bifidobacterium imperatoris]PLS24337.1 tail protein [Bifidobacterium imperatoris]QSY56959.1 tape measure protein [Bifidobacterium imperatoris]